MSRSLSPPYSFSVFPVCSAVVISILLSCLFSFLSFSSSFFISFALTSGAEGGVFSCSPFHPRFPALFIRCYCFLCAVGQTVPLLTFCFAVNCFSPSSVHVPPYEWRECVVALRVRSHRSRPIRAPRCRRGHLSFFRVFCLVLLFSCFCF